MNDPRADERRRVVEEMSGGRPGATSVERRPEPRDEGNVKGRPACLVSRRSSPGSFPRLSFTPVHFSSPGGLVPRAGKKGECWTFLDWRLNSENDSPVHGQPSFDSRRSVRFLGGRSDHPRNQGPEFCCHSSYLVSCPFRSFFPPVGSCLLRFHSPPFGRRSRNGTRRREETSGMNGGKRRDR